MTEDEPLVGDELLWIIVGTWSIGFDFIKDRLDVGSSFVLRTPCSADVAFAPSKREGEVVRLWPLIGQVVTKVVWDDMPDGDGSIELHFGATAVIRILPSDRPRGTLLGKSDPLGRFMVYDF